MDSTAVVGGRGSASTCYIFRTNSLQESESVSICGCLTYSLWNNPIPFPSLTSSPLPPFPAFKGCMLLLPRASVCGPGPQMPLEIHLFCSLHIQTPNCQWGQSEE